MLPFLALAVFAATTPAPAEPPTTEPAEPASSPPPLVLTRNLTLGVRAAAIADAWDFVPSLQRTGGGGAVFVGSTLSTGAVAVEVRGGLEVRALDEVLGYCLDRCGHDNVVLPVRGLRQRQLVPFLEFNLRLFTIGPFTFLGGGVASFPIGTSLDGSDPVTLAFVNGMHLGVRVPVVDDWAFESRVRWDHGLHLVPGVPTEGWSSTAVLDTTLVYTLP